MIIYDKEMLHKILKVLDTVQEGKVISGVESVYVSVLDKVDVDLLKDDLEERYKKLGEEGEEKERYMTDIIEDSTRKELVELIIKIVKALN